MEMKFGLRHDVLQNIVSVIARNSNVERAIIFGSRAKGNHKPGSDVDIALQGDNVSLSDILTIDTELEELWLPLRFDFVIYNSIDEPALKSHIERVGEVIFERTTT